ncbi:FecR domain-containing protein [Chitinophaga solisilvae]|uniref:FecR domain-containing protein n=1 Tax=Chitinophaga solisilvae TaxID=1233460 RepID=UPI0013685144|nr:FecR domain-containing protein [Chitinophaga solisilvae]
MQPPENNQEELIKRYLDGQCTPEEAIALYEQLQASGSQRALLAVMQAEFGRLMSAPQEISPAISNRIETRLLQEIGRGRVVSLRARYRRIWAVAAGLLVLIIASGILIFLNKKSVTAPPADMLADVAPGSNKAMLTLADGSVVTLDSSGHQIIQQGQTKVQQVNGQLQYDAVHKEAAIGYNVLAVPRGGQFNVVLPDGSHIWLNSASSLKYPTAFSGNIRQVELQGQGYFEISPDSRQPFVVKVNDMEVQVLGTHFDIMAYNDENETRTTLIQGAVKVKQGRAEKVLKPGQQVAVDNSTGAFSVVDADIQEVTAWKTGFFEFDNTDMNTIVRQLSRWYDIEIDNRAATSGRRFGGRISRNLPLSDILHMLESNGATFKLEGRKLTVGSAAP